jgi:class 3 adenylate cyclase
MSSPESPKKDGTDGAPPPLPPLKAIAGSKDGDDEPLDAEATALEETRRAESSALALRLAQLTASKGGGAVALDHDLPPVRSDIWDSSGRDPRFFFADGTRTPRGKARAFMDSTPMTILMVTATFWALFAVDIMLLALPREADDWVLGILFFFFIVFVFEFPTLLWIEGKSYLEFYFWLDIFTTVSLLPDVLLLFRDVEENGVLDILTLARAGRAARASSRAARVVRFVKTLSKGKKKSVAAEDFEQTDLDEDEDDLLQSEVSVKFTEATTRRVVGIILLVLIMLAMLDLITPGDWTTAETASKGALEQLALSHQAIAIGEANPAEWRATYLNPFLDTFPESAVLVFNGQPVYTEDISHLRNREVATYDEQPSYKADFNIRSTTRLLAGINLILVCCIIIILAVGNLFFITKADSLVISPVERMAAICRKLVKNPLAQLKGNIYASGETGVVLQMLAKLVGLIQTGFGEAGSRIIAQNLSDEGALNIMVPGIRVDGIYGFCDVRNFTNITEVIGPDCMFLTNTIAEIVHGNTHRRFGSANKNIGDAFLLVWKLWTKPAWKALGRRVDKLPSISKVAASSLNAFLHTIKDMDDSQILAEIGKRAPRFAPIKMGYGLHTGYAIEGAVGSSYKIDASYLSPHLNLASRLEGLTKSYGVPILTSGEFYALLPDSWKAKMRLVDIITVKGSETPLEIYVIDDITPVADDHIMDPPQSPKAPPQVTHRAVHVEGIAAFRKGDWPKARELFQLYDERTGGDRPSQVLLEWMEELGNKVPASFAGFRVLTSKG